MILDPDGKPAASLLGLQSEGVLEISRLDGQRKLLAGADFMSLYDEAGKVRIVASTRDGNVFFQINDEQGRARTVITERGVFTYDEDDLKAVDAESPVADEND